MRAATTLFSILMVLGTTSAQAAGHGRGRCKKPSYPGVAGNGTISTAPSSESGSIANASSTGFEESSIASSISEMMSGSATVTSAIEPESSTASAEAGLNSAPISGEPSVITSFAGSATASPSASSTIGGALVVSDLSSPVALTTTSASSSAPVSSASASNPISVGGSTGVGLAVNSVTGPLTSFTGSGSKMSWYYNWAVGANSDSAGLEFVPMVWGETAVAEVKAASAKWNGVTHVLGFNEPDMGGNVGGSNIAAAKAATLHQEWVTNLGGQYLIGSPAVARGSKKWMDDWLAACDGKCEFDFVPFHFYGTEVDQLIDYVKEFSAAYNKPLWLTEWSCNDFNTGDICDQAEVEAFMKTAIEYFRSSGLVERWAWFGAFPDLAGKGNANGLQNADGSVNEVGKLYLSL